MLAALGLASVTLVTGCDRATTPSATAPEAAAPQSAMARDAAAPVASAANPSASTTPVAPAGSANEQLLAEIKVPPTLTGRGPFILFLHGLGASGKLMSDALKIPALAAGHKFAWAAPDGDFNSKKQRFWNASRACCNFDNSSVSHVDRLRALISAASKHPNIDPKRIYVIGFSNGGFMAHRLACEVQGIAAIASLAGAGPAEGESCAPWGPVAVLQVHGDADETIRYEGGHALSRAALPQHPSAMRTAQSWATREACRSGPKAEGTVDLEDRLEGAETTIQKWSGCSRPVELWTVKGGNHFIAMGPRAQEQILSFLEKQTLP